MNWRFPSELLLFLFLAAMAALAVAIEAHSLVALIHGLPDPTKVLAGDS